ncbi:chromosome segregation protein SMC [Bacteroidota bacterium]
MYLSNLDIVGFKSFARRTSFKFAGGVTGLVGPNGCGKTNIVDAIRWVLGEQKSSILRSDIMEDVIFNGTSKRKPLSMAEVALTLQNTKQILPTEYSEVTIARRLFRNGESHYLLNNTQCRLRDVLDLFMDTGMGADSYSVIELKMVEAILSGKPEERRGLVEEAAGVKKYKLRRKEAGRKLQNVQIDLVRVNDIVVEVEKLVNSLSRQAAKTRRFNKLTEQLKSLEVNLLYHQFSKYKENYSVLNSGFDELKIAKAEKEKQLQSDEESLNELKGKLSELDSNYRTALENENAVNAQISQKTQDIAVANEKISSLETSKERITHELSEFSDAYANLNNQIESSEKSLANVSEQHERIEQELTQKGKDRDEARGKVSKGRDESAFTNEEVLNFQNRINSIFNEIERGKNRKESLERSIVESKAEVDELKVNLTKAKDETKREEEKRQEFKDRFHDMEKALQTAQEHKLALQASMENQREEIAAFNNNLSTKTASLEFLNGLVDSDDSTKYLIKESGWKTKSEKVQLAEAVAVDEKFRVAVAAALGEYSNYFVVENKEEALSAIAKLRESKKGKASFICKNLIPKMKAPDTLPKTEGVYGQISEIVRADKDIKNALRMILGRTVLVENLDAAWDVIGNGLSDPPESNTPEYDCAVTLDGEVVRNKAFVRGGSKLETEGMQVGKQERIENLTKEIKEIESKITTLEENLRNTKSEHDSIDIMELNVRLRKIESEKNSHEHLINQMNYRAEGIEQNISVMEKNSTMFNEEITAIENDTKKFGNNLKELEQNLNLAKEQQLSRSAGLQELEQELSGKEEEYHKVEMERVRYDQEIISLQKEIEFLKERKSELETTEEKRNAEFIQNDKDIEGLKIRISEMESQLVEIKKNADELQTKREFTGKEIGSLKEQISHNSDDINIKRKEYEKLFESIHQQELKVSELNNKLEYVENRALEGYDINLGSAEIQLDEGFSIENTKNEVNGIKEKLAGLGNVNFMALEEFETQNERLQFYRNQVNDLQEAEKNLIETIDEINQTAQEKFRETFDKVNKFFQGLFTKLFGEGAEADLQLTEGDPLEADIEIIAKPPGKRPRSIEGLSGGEKTLAAIALLFAIYLVKPSPFCILDEVDAPLDDANIDRFVNLIKDFSKETQFMIVTHNKKTMEEADSLYGITMEEEGVSKVVSVRLSKENNN